MRKSSLFSVVVLSSFLSICHALSIAATEIRDDISTESFSPEETLSSIKPYSDSTPGMDAVLVIDVSGSMKQSDPDYLCKKAALNFVEDLSLSPSSRAAVITFSDTLQDVIPLTSLDSFSEENEIVKELNALEYTAGDTDIGTALQKAASLLSASDDNRAKSIYLLTDGEIDLPAAPDEEAAEKESLTKALMAVEEAKTQGIVIHTVALDLTGGMDENLMNYAADSTGGTSSLINSASDLEDVFQRLSEYAAAQAAEYTETETEVQTEEMTEAEPETETETETEAQAVPVVSTIGSIDGPVHLKGLVPNLCTAKLNLSELFRLEGSPSGFTDSILYTAYSDDNTLLNCSVEGDQLVLGGLKNGTTHVQVIAQPSLDNPWSNSNDPAARGYDVLSYGENEPVEDMSQASISFAVEIDAMIPDWRYLLAIPALLLAGFLLAFFLKNKEPSSIPLHGSLQWYVRGENEKIFGMPSQTLADLSDYGNKVRLSELVEDDLLQGAALDKVVISGAESGIVIASKSRSCLIAAAGEEPMNRLEMTRSGRFKVFCETGNGKACVIAFYTTQDEYKAEPSYEDDSGERTRLLV